MMVTVVEVSKKLVQAVTGLVKVIYALIGNR